LTAAPAATSWARIASVTATLAAADDAAPVAVEPGAVDPVAVDPVAAGAVATDAVVVVAGALEDEQPAKTSGTATIAVAAR